MSSCGEVVEYDKATQLQLDIDSIKRFISKTNLNFEAERSGLHSQILSVGTEDITIQEDDEIIVSYTGKLLNGIIVESGDSVKLKYSGLIEGWRAGLLKIKPGGGSIRLLIPSTMAYTNKQVGPIPPNSNLDYVIVFRAIIRDKVQYPAPPVEEDPDAEPEETPEENPEGEAAARPVRDVLRTLNNQKIQSK